MSTEPKRTRGAAAPSRPAADAGLEDAVRDLLLLMPRLVARAKRIPPPPELRDLTLGPRHLSLLVFLLLDGPMTVNDLAARLQVAPTTTSLVIADLSRKGVLHRAEDDTDRRRRIISITPAARPAIETWLAPGAEAWRRALRPLTPAQRRTVVDALLAYEAAVGELREG
ncbi:transcriptional regulator, MarR family [Catenulispora acidiphila DSM 44928]|uniref:Transcriptional regulator, MarR family n=1 Tax=Catenulispora acidiphila (strain DSM 44928 / JCM 14897 / NBRC 102108 / NRRL B-24433 / ID139908) TaxID=479433 RepID=C7QEJ3_CATAD|nr:MarR family winged helix-turn-helix transcriptional regulator [Catenulispora acidiphila]ACU70884.1 transcriptional regulator, MarR family [Catenulispora acidiphila DSM 44928]